MSDDVSTVEYREIQGFPGYRVGDDGSVWSAWRRHFIDNGKRGGTFSLIGDSWRLLKLHAETRRKRTPHFSICLKGGGRCRTTFVHTLVLEAFVGPAPDGMECLHRNGDPQDNRLANLRWGTRKENVADQLTHGDFAVGIRHGNGKYSDELVREIFLAEGKHADVAAKFGVTRKYVTQLKGGKVRRPALGALLDANPNAPPNRNDIRIAPAKNIFTTNELANMIGCSSQTVSSWCASDKLRSYRIPGTLGVLRVTRSGLLEFLEKLGCISHEEDGWISFVWTNHSRHIGSVKAVRQKHVTTSSGRRICVSSESES